MTGSSWARNSANSAMPPSWRNFSSRISGPRRSRMTSSRPGTMNAVCWARPSRPSNSNVASLVKICRSGQNRMRVPDLVLGDPAALAGQPGPRRERRAGALAVEDARGAVPERDALLGRRPVDVDVHPRRERVDDREPDAVQAAGGDVGAATELAAGVQLGDDHLDAGQAGPGLLVGRDAAAVVVDLGRAVGVEGHLDVVGGAGQRLVHAVVDDLPQAVHQAAGVGGADVHARPLADRLEALEDQEVCGVVGGVDRVLLGRAWTGCHPDAGWTESTRDTPKRHGGTPAGGRVYRDEKRTASTTQSHDNSHHRCTGFTVLTTRGHLGHTLVREWDITWVGTPYRGWIEDVKGRRRRGIFGDPVYVAHDTR